MKKMEKVKIRDSLFAHVDYSTLFQESKYLIWDRSPINSGERVFYTDHSLKECDRQATGEKYAWLLESPQITSDPHNWIKDNYNKFTNVFTHNKKLLDMSDKFKFAPTGGCWVKPEHHKIFDKTKNVSIIASGKNFLPGHKLRHEVVNKFNGSIDLFGRKYKSIEEKVDGLRDYRFSFAIENIREDYYFTEKLIDCFVTGTVPIYWGCSSIGEFFNKKGMVILNSVHDLNIKDLNEELYNEMKPYIEENFEKAKKYLISEDYIWENYFVK